MAGKRQPTSIVVANGKKHLTKAEIDERLDSEVRVPAPEKAVPPKWLPKKFHAEFQELGELLLRAGLYAELDRDILAQYLVTRERWARADKLTSAAIREKDEKLAKEWGGLQSTYFKQCRQCAEAMGLSITSRCRISLPTALQTASAPDDEEDEFTRRLHARQAGAFSASG